MQINTDSISGYSSGNTEITKHCNSNINKYNFPKWPALKK